MSGTKFTIWTKNVRPSWLAHNFGCSDMILVTGLSWDEAVTSADRIRHAYQDGNVEIHPDNKPPQLGTVGEK